MPELDVGGDKLRKMQAHWKIQILVPIRIRIQDRPKLIKSYNTHALRRWDKGRLSDCGEHDTRSKSKQCNRGTFNLFFLTFSADDAHREVYNSSGLHPQGSEYKLMSTEYSKRTNNKTSVYLLSLYGR